MAIATTGATAFAGEEACVGRARVESITATIMVPGPAGVKTYTPATRIGHRRAVGGPEHRGRDPLPLDLDQIVGRAAELGDLHALTPISFQYDRAESKTAPGWGAVEASHVQPGFSFSA